MIPQVPVKLRYLSKTCLHQISITNSNGYSDAIRDENVWTTRHCCFCKLFGDGPDGEGILVPVFPEDLRPKTELTESKEESVVTQQFAHEFCLIACPTIFFDEETNSYVGVKELLESKEVSLLTPALPYNMLQSLAFLPCIALTTCFGLDLPYLSAVRS